MQRVYEENEWGKVSKRIVTDSGADGLIGIDKGFKSSKLNLVSIVSMYAC